MKIKLYKTQQNRSARTFYWVSIIIFVCILFIIQGLGSFTKPLLLIPAALCISMYEDELNSAIAGTLCGFLLDISCNKILGYNAIILLCFCVCTSLLFTHLLRQNLFNIMAISTVFAFIHQSLDYLFYFAVWNHKEATSIFFNYSLPCSIYTALSTLIIYWIIKKIKKFFEPTQRLILEENNEIIIKE